MKELSIEEKATRYDEAIERANSLLSGNQLGNAWIYELLPELKESEGERIRKALVEFVHDTTGDSLWVYYNVHKEDALAWLEKQGEQKPTQEIEPTPIFKIGDILKRKGKDYTFRVDRIQGGYYHCDRNHGAFFPIEEQGNWELVEQKPAWSEEDEEMFNAVIADIQFTQKAHNHEVNQIVYEREIDWLKSLKDRVQPKQEWSEEDDFMVENVRNSFGLHCGQMTNTLKEQYDKFFNKVKSLRPQNTWNPSELQIEALAIAIRCGIKLGTWEEEALKDLIEQLKKLREE